MAGEAFDLLGGPITATVDPRMEADMRRASEALDHLGTEAQDASRKAQQSTGGWRSLASEVGTAASGFRESWQSMGAGLGGWVSFAQQIAGTASRAVEGIADLSAEADLLARGQRVLGVNFDQAAQAGGRFVDEMVAQRAAMRLYEADVQFTQEQLDALIKVSTRYAADTGDTVEAATERLTGALISGSARGLRPFGAELMAVSGESHSATDRMMALSRAAQNTEAAADNMRTSWERFKDTIEDTARDTVARFRETTSEADRLQAALAGVDAEAEEGGGAWATFVGVLGRAYSVAEGLSTVLMGLPVAAISAILNPRGENAGFNMIGAGAGAVWNVLSGEDARQEQMAGERADMEAGWRREAEQRAARQRAERERVATESRADRERHQASLQRVQQEIQRAIQQDLTRVTGGRGRTQLAENVVTQLRRTLADPREIEAAIRDLNANVARAAQQAGRSGGGRGTARSTADQWLLELETAVREHQDRTMGPGGLLADTMVVGIQRRFAMRAPQIIADMNRELREQQARRFQDLTTGLGRRYGEGIEDPFAQADARGARARTALDLQVQLAEAASQRSRAGQAVTTEQQRALDTIEATRAALAAQGRELDAVIARERDLQRASGEGLAAIRDEAVTAQDEADDAWRRVRVAREGLSGARESGDAITYAVERARVETETARAQRLTDRLEETRARVTRATQDAEATRDQSEERVRDTEAQRRQLQDVGERARQIGRERSFTEQMKGEWRERATAAQGAAQFTRHAYETMSQAAAQHLAAVIQGKEEFGAAMTAMLGEVATKLGTEAILKSLYELAEGIAAVASYRYDAATEHFAAAAAYGALGTMAVAAGGALSGGSAPTSAPSAAAGPQRAATAPSTGASGGGGGQVYNLHFYAPVVSGAGSTPADVGVVLTRDLINPAIRQRGAEIATRGR